MLSCEMKSTAAEVLKSVVSQGIYCKNVYSEQMRIFFPLLQGTRTYTVYIYFKLKVYTVHSVSQISM